MKPRQVIWEALVERSIKHRSARIRQRMEWLCALIMLIGGLALLGAKIYQSFARGNPAFVAVYDEVGRMVSGEGRK